MRTAPTAWALILCAVLVFALGCGGGGDPASPVFGNELFQGDYATANLRAEAGPPRKFVTWWGTATAYGTGLHDLSITENDTGAVSVSAPGSDLSYAVYADRAFTWEHPAMPGTELLRGGITSDGHVAALATVFNGTAPVWLLYNRVGANTFNLGSLNGIYHLVSLRLSVTLVANAAQFGTVTFDGNGGVTGAVGLNRDGSVPLGTVPITGGYTVSSAGALTIDWGSGDIMTGSLGADGTLLTVTGSTTNGEDPAIQLLLRASTTASASTLAGSYFATGVRYDVGASAYVSATGTMIADGTSSVTLAATLITESVLSIPPPEIASYTVAPDGALIVTTSGGEILAGAVSSDGVFAILGGATNPGSDPQLYLFLR